VIINFTVIILGVKYNFKALAASWSWRLNDEYAPREYNYRWLGEELTRFLWVL